MISAKGKIYNGFKVVFVLIILFITQPGFSQYRINEILKKADTMSNLHKKASSYLFLAEYFAEKNNDSTSFFAQKALDIALPAMDYSCIGDSYKYLAIAASNKRNCSLSEKYFESGKNYLPTKDDSAGFFADMGAVFTLCGNLQKAQKCYSIAKSLYQNIDDKINTARLLINMGVMYSQNSNFFLASESYHEALQLCEQINDSSSLAVIYQNLGQVMALQNQYDKAVGYFNSALRLFKEQNRPNSMAAVYLNLGQIYIEQKQWDVAKHYLNKSYVIDTALNLIDYESIALKSLGETYLQTAAYSSAERLISEAIRLQRLYGFKTEEVESAISLAEVYLFQNRIKEALKLIEQTEPICIALDNKYQYSRLLKIKSKALEKSNNYKQALLTHKQATNISDSIFNIRKTKSIMDMEFAYQTEKKEKQIASLQYNDIIKQEQLKTRKVQIILLIIGVSVLALGLILVLVFIRRKQQFEIKQKEQKYLQASFDAEEKAKDKIARELHDDIGGRLIGLIMGFETKNSLNENNLKQLQLVYQDVRRLSHSLDKPMFHNISLQQKLINYFSEIKDQHNFEINFIDDLNLNWKTIENNNELQRNVYRIIQELITNTIKYASASELEIQLMNEKNKLILTYEDNGIGISTDKISDSESFKTIKKRVDIFDGKFELKTENEKGIFVLISLKYTKNNSIS